MRRNDLQRVKIKRILMYYNELEKHQICHDGSLQLISYIFCVSGRWIEEILRKYDINDFADIELNYINIDTIIIDAYVDNLHKKVRKQRSN